MHDVEMRIKDFFYARSEEKLVKDRKVDRVYARAIEAA